MEDPKTEAIDDKDAIIASLEARLEMQRTSYETNIAELNILLEISNERWVKQVNENTQLELQLRTRK